MEVCATADLNDDDCERITNHVQTKWLSERPGCFPPPENVDEEHVFPATLPPVWRLTEATSPAAVARRVARPWRDRGIQKADVDAALESNSDCVLFQILKGRVFVEPRSRWNETQQERPWRSRRRKAVFDLLTTLAPDLDRDLEVVFCPTDCVVSSSSRSFDEYHSTVADEVPALTLVGCSKSLNLPFPVFDVRSHDLNESLANWDVVVEKLERNRYKFPNWTDRDQRAAFRGQVQGKSCWYKDRLGTDHSTQCGRRKLFIEASEYPEKFDVDFNFVPLLAQERYRYLIYAEGHCGWSDRLRFLLFLRSAVLMQETICNEFFALGLVPWVHYLPLEYHFTDLSRVYDWAQAHPEFVDRIVANMNSYAAAFLSEAAIRSYALTLLQELSRALRYAPVHRSGMASSLPLDTTLDLLDDAPLV